MQHAITNALRACATLLVLIALLFALAPPAQAHKPSDSYLSVNVQAQETDRLVGGVEFFYGGVVLFVEGLSQFAMALQAGLRHIYRCSKGDVLFV